VHYKSVREDQTSVGIFSSLMKGCRMAQDAGDVWAHAQELVVQQVTSSTLMIHKAGSIGGVGCICV
jgi:hypothetical protein